MSTEAHALGLDESAGEDEYQAFYAVLAGTARGRAFLDEHARRMRHAETEVLLAALKRLENQVAAQAAAPAPPSPASGEIRAALEMLDTVQRRLSALLPAATAAAEPSAPAAAKPPFALAITAVAAQALAGAHAEDEPIKVIKAGSMPPPPVFEGEDFSADAEADELVAEPETAGVDELQIGGAPSPASEEDPLAPLLALSEEERLALFS
jgi:hypothetical protein